MDIIILGLLMIRHSTIYELKQYVGKFLTSVSSNGTGSIQASIKKLLKQEMITYKEQVQNGVNKKIYSITEDGKKHIEDSLSIPMLYKEKNMELNKLFFMGFISRDKQIASIINYIQELEKELNHLEQINASLNPRFNFSEVYIEEARSSSGAPEFITKEGVHDIAIFQYATLDLGIAKIKFEIDWFNRFKEELEMGEMRNETK